MAQHVLIVPDKFKGTLSASAAAQAIAQGWHEARPDDVLDLLPMSDGGDGFGEVLAKLLPVEARICPTVDAAHRPCNAMWWWDPANHMALIESARVIGLALLPPKKFHPFELDTFGLGAVIQAVTAAGSARCVVGIGGSATNDGGFGLATALGWSFFDHGGEILRAWTDLKHLSRVEPPPGNRVHPEIVVAVDVQNPLLGPMGASHVYGPQKGLRPEDVPLAEVCLARLAEVTRRDLGSDADIQPGSGAAGGLGFGLRCFLNAKLESGFNLFAQHAHLESRIRTSDLVITGEGAIDSSTLMGKGVGEIAHLCRKHRVRCVGLAGILNLGSGQRGRSEPFTELYGIAPGMVASDEAMRMPQHWLTRLAAAVASKQPS